MMVKIMDRSAFSEYCLRALGKPVINIEITAEQIEDRIEEAIGLWTEWHHDATETRWISYFITQDDIDNKYISIPEATGIYRVLQLRPLYEGSGDNLFDPVYQITRQAMLSFNSFDKIDYYMKMTDLTETLDMITPTPTFEYVVHKRRLYANQDLSKLGEGYPFAMKVNKYIDPEEFEAVYNDRWLKKYTIALLKKQWASNIKKYEQVQLLGGVVISGKELYEEANEEVKELEVQLEEKYSEPVGFIIG